MSFRDPQVGISGNAGRGTALTDEVGRLECEKYSLPWVESCETLGWQESAESALNAKVSGAWLLGSRREKVQANQRPWLVLRSPLGLVEGVISTHLCPLYTMAFWPGYCDSLSTTDLGPKDAGRYCYDTGQGPGPPSCPMNSAHGFL